MATREDLYYCYRLILNREPDPEGWESWGRLVDAGAFGIERLTTAFLNSEEFRDKQARGHLPVPIRLETFTIHIRGDDWAVGAEIRASGRYEPHVTAELHRSLAAGTVFVDVGANIGYFSLLAASITGPHGRVIAFEPNSENCDLIRLSAEANGFRNITVYQKAVADRERTFSLAVEGSNGSVSERQAPGDILVSAISLDEALADEQRVDVIKMDIEGCEGLALRGMAAVLARHRPVLLTEYNPDGLQAQSHIEPERYLDDLRGMKYDLYVLTPGRARSRAPQSSPEIHAAYMARQAEGGTHLDLAAYPRS